MDEKEKGLPMIETLRRQLKDETMHYFKRNGIYGGCWALLGKAVLGTVFIGAIVLIGALIWLIFAVSVTA